MARDQTASHRGVLNRDKMISLQHWHSKGESQPLRQNVVVDCGWGRLVLGQTFSDNDALVAALMEEAEGERDIAIYVRDPHVALSKAPQDLFMDPSHTYRLPLGVDLPECRQGLVKIRPYKDGDQEAIRRIYLGRRMVPQRTGFFASTFDPEITPLLVAENAADGAVVGVVMGVDHMAAFGDPDQGSSLWALAVDPQAMVPGAGFALTVSLAELFRKRGRHFMDLSVLHNNSEAIALYEKLGFQRVPVYCLKRKNPINEPLFVGPDPASELNIYATILVDEARRRGIGVELLDAKHGYFRLTHGGRSVVCRESLTELTSAIALSRCDNKAVTRKILTEAGLSMPAQIETDNPTPIPAMLGRFGRIVVKPARGEQGQGVAVDLTTLDEALAAFENARTFSETVLLEEFVEGQDLRVIVIDRQVVAAAVRRPPVIQGDGEKSIRDLIKNYSRRREAATGGESRVPMDIETERCVRQAGYRLDESLAQGVELFVRKTANLHTGGTINDVTDCLHPDLAAAAVTAAVSLDIPVVGLDFLVPNPAGPKYVIIEANERPGLANHEPQPTAQRFIDFLFPQTAASRGDTN